MDLLHLVKDMVKGIDIYGQSFILKKKTAFYIFVLILFFKQMLPGSCPPIDDPEPFSFVKYSFPSVLE